MKIFVILCYTLYMVYVKTFKEGREYGMPNTAETIESLARKLERVRILNDLKECKTLEEFQELTKKYETLCNNDKN